MNDADSPIVPMIVDAAGRRLVIRSVWIRGRHVAAEKPSEAASRPVPTVERKRRALRAFFRNPSAVAGLCGLVLIGLAALAAPVVYPQDPLSMVGLPLLWPGADVALPLGTDSLGRDVTAQLMHGARISLLVGVAATLIGLAAGVIAGAGAGYFGGRADSALVRVIEIFQTLPSFVLLVVIVAVLQPSTMTVTLAIGLTSWPTVARLTRAEFRSLRTRDFVTAARALGFGRARIIFIEILPSALPPIIVTASMMVASAILMESTLAFMGLGDPQAVS